MSASKRYPISKLPCVTASTQLNIVVQFALEVKGNIFLGEGQVCHETLHINTYVVLLHEVTHFR